MDQFRIVCFGYNCFPKKYLSQSVDRKTEYFDNIGSSAWSIYELLKTDFQDHMDTSKLKPIQMHKNDKNYLMIVNLKYFLRFPHDIPARYTKDQLTLLINRYQRRCERITDLLYNTQDHLLFLRLEEPYDVRREITGRIKSHVPDNDNFQTHSDFEFKYMRKISYLLREKFNLTFAILYLSQVKPTHFHQADQIICLNYEKEIDYHQSFERIDEILKNNQKFINQSLQKILQTVNQT